MSGHEKGCTCARGPYDTVYDNDLPHKHVVTMIQKLHANGEKIVFFSGRKESGRTSTMAWLLTHVGLKPGDYDLFMRADDDNRKDSFVKYDLFNEHVRGKFNVSAIFDDRKQ